MKLIYQNIKERLLTEVPALKAVWLDNSQFEDAVANTTRQNPFNYPAVLLSFQDIAYQSDTSGVQKGSMVLRVRLGYKSLSNEDLDMFDVRDAIHKALQNHAGEDLFEALVRVAEAQDTEHGYLNVWAMDYTCNFTDTSAAYEADYVEVNASPLVNKDEVPYLIP